MKLCVHTNTVRLLDFFEDENNYDLVIELETGSTLSSYMQERKNLIKEMRARDISHRVAQGIEYLHDFGILIGQLDLESIMMTDVSDSAVPRISKFSKARILFPG
jgi:serine/threonine protein kinase